jgi:outer membrane protein assembly factor BamB
MKTKTKHTRIAQFAVLLFVAILLGCTYQIYGSKDEPPSIIGKQPIWAYKTDGPILSCLPNKNSGVFIYTSDAVYLVDSATGKLSWKTNLANDTDIYRKYTVETGIKSNEQTLIVQRDNGDVVSLAKSDGQLLWQNASQSQAPVFDMAINHDYAYVARLSSALTVYDAYTGTRIWSNSVPDRTSLYVFPISGKVYLGTSYELFGYDAQTGNLLLEHKFDGLVEKMLVDADHIYVAYPDSGISFASLDTETLEQRWSIPPLSLSLSVVNSILVESDVVYITGSKVVAVSALNGDLLWVSDAIDSFGRPVIQKNLLIVQGKTHLYVFDKVDGRMLSSQRLPGPFPLLSWMSYSQANPCQSETMFWLAHEKTLYAYDLSE